MRRRSTAQSGGGLTALHTAVVFSGGLSVTEYVRTNANAATAIAAAAVPAVDYLRGPDMGGGVGGLIATVRSSVNANSIPTSGTKTSKFNFSSGRGDIVAQSDASGAFTWTATYEGYGKRLVEVGGNLDKQRANSKDEDPTGLLNEGFRYRDIETGVWLSRDPAGFVDGPNLYAYVRQNPWTSFDPLGLRVPTNETEAKTVAHALHSKLNKHEKLLSKRPALEEGLKRYQNKPGAERLEKLYKDKLSLINSEITASARDVDYHAESLELYIENKDDPHRLASFNELERWSGSYAPSHAIRDMSYPMAETVMAITGGYSLLKGGYAVLSKFAAKGGAETVSVFRGVPSDHNNATMWANALEGRSLPLGGHANPAAHAGGNTRSIFTSWTTDVEVARDFATGSGRGVPGVILQDQIPRRALPGLLNPYSIGGEAELLRGSVSGAKVIPVSP